MAEGAAPRSGNNASGSWRGRVTMLQASLHHPVRTAAVAPRESRGMCTSVPCLARAALPAPHRRGPLWRGNIEWEQCRASRCACCACADCFPRPAQIRTHPVLLGECLGGALYVQDFKRLCREAGFLDPRQLSSEPIEVRGWLAGFS